MRRYAALQAEYDVELNLRPVYPLAIREPDFFERNHANWLGYVMRDVFRLAQNQGIVIAPPRPDPIVQDMATRQISSEQPHIFRLTRLGQVAARRNKSLAFCDEVSRLIWGGIENWHEGNYLAEAAQRAGLNLSDLDDEASADAAALDDAIADNQRALEAAGHWGVPTLVFEEEPFFGQDRIELAVWRMKQKGMVRR